MGGPLGSQGVPWTMTFVAGGCGTFLPLFYRLLSEIHESRQGATLQQAAENGNLGQVAFMDPNDPSTLFLTQPSAAPNSQENTPFQSAEPSAPPPAGGGGARRNTGQDCVIS